MPERKRSAEAERLRQKALSRWENEGGAEPCGPIAAGAETRCEGDGSHRREAVDRAPGS